MCSARYHISGAFQIHLKNNKSNYLLALLVSLVLQHKTLKRNSSQRMHPRAHRSIKNIELSMVINSMLFRSGCSAAPQGADILLVTDFLCSPSCAKLNDHSLLPADRFEVADWGRCFVIVVDGLLPIKFTCNAPMPCSKPKNSSEIIQLFSISLECIDCTQWFINPVLDTHVESYSMWPLLSKWP